MLDQPLQGSIADLSLAHLIARLHREGFDGALRVTVGGTTKLLYFRGGEIASAASNAESDRLANILIRDGRLSQEQLDLARARLQPGGSLGKTLIDMGFLSPGELLQGARQQVREILASCFALSSGEFQVEPGPLPGEVTSLGLPTRRLMFDCIMQARDRQWIVRQVGSMESVYRPTENLVDGLGALKLDVEMDQVGRMLDGSHTLRDISGRTSLDDFTVSKMILALETLGLAERIGEPPPADATMRSRAIPIAADVPAPPAPQEEPREAAAGPAPGVTPSPVPVAPARPVGDRTPGITPEREERAAEPPPIPSHELPAFAVPPGEEPGWQIDPDTGERVRLGPVEITFDGAVGVRPERRRRPPGLYIAAGIAFVLVVAGLAYISSLRRGASELAGGGERPGLADAGEETTTPAPLPDVEAPEEAAATAPPAARTAPEAAPPPPPEPPPPVAGTTPAPGVSGRAPAAMAVPESEGAAETGPAGDARQAAALRRFDAGDAPGAASAFLERLAGEDASRLTLQLMIACEVESVRKVRRQAGAESSLLIVPYTLGDRDCYRVLWGLYDSRDEAEDATTGIPAPLIEAGVRPVVVSVGKLKPPA